ncbi:MAG: dihydroorotase [Dehalococcoidaceae bacterium]|nr:dihydroorotase [Dehalococcoidaceae bacterium]
MSSSILIKNGRVIDPAGTIDRQADVLIRNGLISNMSGKGQFEDAAVDQVIDAEGMTVCPGLIDLHCHLREPGQEDKETIKTGSEAAAKGGFTTICCMPNTKPPIDTAAAVSYVNSIAARDSAIRILPIGCITKNRKGEELAPMYELAQAGVVGFSDDGSPVIDASLMLRAMQYAGPLGLPIIEHCEDLLLSGGGLMNEGDLANIFGLPGIPAAAEEIMVARDILLAKNTGIHIHIAHISTRGSVEIVRFAKKLGIKVTAEVTPHHLTLTETAVAGYNTNAKVNPPLRRDDDVQSLIEGLNDGTIDLISTDHAPHTTSEKEQEFGLAPAGISGFETALSSLLSLVHQGKMEMVKLIEAMTVAPAGILQGRFGKLGTLSPGSIADVTIFDPNREWRVDASSFISRGKNTPLHGKTLKGKVIITISRGEVVYRLDP